MTWMHIAGLGIAAILAIAGALTQTTDALLPLAGTIVGGVFGHAMGDRKAAVSKKPSKEEG
jgi:hypothetical protein